MDVRSWSALLTRVTPRSRFLNLAADNHVSWSPEPTLVKCDGYHFVLMPRTSENVQSIHIDLRENGLDDSSAVTVIRRFLSIMAWCDDNFATLGFGWLGNPVPVPVTKPELAFRIMISIVSCLQTQRRAVRFVPRGVERGAQRAYQLCRSKLL